MGGYVIFIKELDTCATAALSTVWIWVLPKLGRIMEEVSPCPSEETWPSARLKAHSCWVAVSALCPAVSVWGRGWKSQSTNAMGVLKQETVQKKQHLYLLQEYFLKLLTYRFLSGKISFQVITFLSWDICFLYLLINLLFL